jgi:hypothetical protein
MAGSKNNVKHTISANDNMSVVLDYIFCHLISYHFLRKLYELCTGNL